MPNCIENLVIFNACIITNSKFMPLEQATDIRVLNNLIRMLKPDLIISDKQNKYKVPSSKFLKIKSDNSFNWVGSKSVENFDNKIESSLIINSSGTTSKGKIIEIDIERLIKSSLQIKKFYSLNKRTFMNLMSTSYLGGLFNLYLIPIISNSNIVFFETFGTFDTLKLIKHIDKYKIDTLWINPSLVKSIYELNFKNKFKFKKKIKNIFCGTAYLSKDIKRLFMNRYKISILESYGLTETTFISCEKKNSRFKFSPGYVGQIMDGIKIIIKKKRRSKYGSLLVKSPYIFKRYLGNKSFGRKLYSTKVFDTEDLGFLKNKKHLFLVGRNNQLIKKRGYFVNLNFIESKILKLNFIDEVKARPILDNDKLENFDLYIKIKKNVKIKVDKLNKTIRNYLNINEQPRNNYIVKKFEKTISGKIKF